MLIEELNGDRASKIIGKIDTVLIPVGTLEPHGPHCSILTDSLIAEWMTKDIDRIIGDKIYVTPPIVFEHTWHLQKVPGAHDVSGRILADYLFEVIKGFKQWQVKFAVIINGHGGNLIPIGEAAERAADIGIKTMMLNWWIGTISQGLEEVVTDIFGHGGEAETSIMMSLGEKYVDPKLIPKEAHEYAPAGFYDRYDPDTTESAYRDAYTGSPFLASKEKGERIRKKVAERMVENIEAFRQGKFVKSTATAWG